MRTARKERAARESSRDETLKRALQHHAAGRYDDAAALYRRLHDEGKPDGEVVFLMGVLCCDLGLFDAACRFIEEALAISPRFPEARAQLVVALNGQAELAIGGADLTGAARLLERALTLAPGDAVTLQSLGRLALMQDDLVVAEARLLDSLTRRPGHVQTLNWLGLARLSQDKYAAAESALRQALDLQPDINQIRNNLGLALYHQERLAEAARYFEAALAQDPAYAKARVNLGLTLRLMGDVAGARAHFEAVLAAQPDDVDALNNLGVIFQDLGMSDAALRNLSRALELSPANAPIRWNLSLTQLLRGDFAGGWANFEARWTGCEHLRGGYGFPAERAWRGEPLAGKRLLLWAEQGFGDTLQFIRFARDLALQGALISVVAPPELVDLLRTAPGVGEVGTPDGAPPAYDYHCPLLSLPLRLGLTVDANRLHAGTPYLFPAADQVGNWCRRLEGHRGLKVGLVWAGSSRQQSLELRAIDARRSIALRRLKPILATAGCSFFSLQKGDAAREVTDPALCGSGSGPVHDYSSEWRDFADTAAFLANLDLVISVDTAVAHLAGAQGTPVWLLNRRDSCWRWLQEREDSPWYGKMRVFRQPALGDWEPVIARVAAVLAEAVAGFAAGGSAG